MKAVVFNGAIPRYLATRAAGAVSSRAVVGPGRCTEVRDVEPPALPGDRWVRVATRLGGICGSDVSLVSLHVSPSTSPFSSFPFVIGHENVGTVMETGSAVTRVKPGHRVVANPLLACRERGIDPPCAHCAAGHPSRCEHFTDGALAPGMLLGTTRGLGGSWGEQYLAHEDQLLHVDDSVSDQAAVLTEPLACVVSPILAHPFSEGARVLIIGAGAMGLLALAALKSLAAVDATVLCRHAYQAEHAEHLGADRVVMTRGGDYVAELARITGSRLLKPILGPRINVGGFDASMVCVGNDAAVNDALRFTRSGGTVVLLGNVARLARVDWTPVWLKELTLHGSLCYHGSTGHGGTGSGDFAAAARLIAGPLGKRLEPLVTHTVPLSNARDAIMIALGRSRERAVKVAIKAS
ncbi:MAG TPA: alcohol dehydrogenase catalytic domain-containing protein [Candidatus Krumholzibacteria bacterium]|nr:alcohol dehydrogenase catalytic domain-containing protein [Candidatus Krumholzibacteria bacterium]